MATSTPRNKRFYYKRVRFLTDSEKTLQVLLAEVFRRKPKPSARTQGLTLADDEENELAVIYKATHKGMLCGILHHCKPGDPVLATIYNEEAENYMVEQLAPPKSEDGKRREFIKHLLYFGIRENHIIVVQSQGMTTKELEEHLNWLLKRSTKVMDEKNHVSAEDNVPEQYRNRPIVGAKSVIITTNPEVVASREDSSTEKSPSSAEVSANRKQLMVLEKDPIVEALLDLIKKKNPSFSKRQAEELDTAFEAGNLEARIELRYKGRNKGQKSPVVDDLAHALRHSNDLDYKIEMPHGEPLESAKARISRLYSVKRLGSLPRTDDLFDKMVIMLDDLVKAGEVST